METRNSLTHITDTLALLVSFAFVSLLPVLYFSGTTEFVEYAKLILVIVSACALLAIWSFRAIVTGKLSLVKTPFDMQFVFLLVSIFLATWFSVSINTSVYGEYNVWHLTFVEFLALVVNFYGLTVFISSTKMFKKLFVAFLNSVTIVAMISLGVYFNFFDGFFQDSGPRILRLWTIDGFSPAGNAVSLVYLIGIALILVLAILFFGWKQKNSVQYLFFDRIPARLQTIVLVAKAFVFILTIVLWLGAYIPGVPQRVQTPTNLPLSYTWRVASSAIRDYPFVGTGPSTFNSAYQAFRSARINQEPYWNNNFYRGGSEYLTWLTTMGVLGFGALVIFGIKVLVVGFRSLIKGSDNESRMKYTDDFVFSLKKPLIMIVVGTLVLFLFIPSNVMILSAFFLILTFWMVLEKLEQGLVSQANLTLELVNEKLLSGRRTQAAPGESHYSFIPVLAGGLALIIAGLGTYYTWKDVRSNRAFASSIQGLADNAPVQQIYDAQRLAITLNPRRDAYRRAYANTNITVARLVAQQRGESLTETEREDIVQLVSQALREVRIITENLNPTSALNWQIRGRVYQNLLGVARGADQWALQAYQQAIVLAPNDPQLRVDLGGLFLSLAVNAPKDEGTQGEPPSENAPTVPQTRAANLLRAEAAFQDAIRLKPDYASAHFNLSVVYREAGQVGLAIKELQTTLTLLDTNSEDYQRANQILSELQELQENQQDQSTPEPTPTPTPTSVAPSVSSTPTPTETPAVTPEATPTATP